MSTSHALTGAAAPPRPAPAGGDADRGRWLALVVVALAQLMVVLDATIVNIALPTAQRSLGFSNDDRQWVVTGYALVFGSLLLLGGRLSDFFGRKRMFVIGLVGFALASAVGGAAQDFTMLLVARALQGAFAAALAPAALSLLAVTFTEPAERAKAFGIYGAISGAGGAAGLLLGGLLTEYLSWRWCLYVNLPIAALALIGAAVRLHDGPRPKRPRLDLPGALLAVAGLVGVVYGLADAETHGWRDAVTWGPIVAGAVLLLVFVLVERRSAHPLLPLRVVTDRTRAGAYLTLGITGVGLFGVFLFLTYYLANTLGYSPVKTGSAFLPMMAAVITTASLAGARLVPRVGPRPLVPTGAVLAAAGMALLTRLDLDSTYTTGVLPALLVLGVGMGLVFAPVQNAATAGVAAQDAGVASALINTVQQIGGSIGTALLSSFAATAASDYLTSHASGAAPTRRLLALATLDGYHTVFWWSAGFFAACAVVAAVLFRSGPLLEGAGADPAADPSSQTAPGGAVEGSPAQRAAAEVAPVAGERTDADLVLSGAVRQEGGRALPGAVVTLTDPSGQQVARATSDADGRYAVALPTGGTYVLVVVAEHVPPVASSVVVADRSVTKDVLLSGSSSLAGRVLSRRRTPVRTGATAMGAMSPGTAGGTAFDGARADDGVEGVEGAVITLTDIRGEVVGSTTTDEHGGYAFAQLVGGAYVLTAQSSGRRPLARAVYLPDAGQADCDLLLPAGGRVAGTVVSARDGRRLPEASVTLVDGEGAVVGSAVTGEDGTYTFDDLSAGTYTLTAAGYAPVTTPVQVLDDQVASTQFQLGSRP